MIYWVYVAQVGDDPLLHKVGWSMNPFGRVKGLSKQYGRQFNLVMMIANGCESHAHRRLRRWRRPLIKNEREFFRCSFETIQKALSNTKFSPDPAYICLAPTIEKIKLIEERVKLDDERRRYEDYLLEIAHLEESLREIDKRLTKARLLVAQGAATGRISSSALENANGKKSRKTKSRPHRTEGRGKESASRSR